MEQQTINAVDVYQIVTDRIIELLEAETIPWKKPWIEAGLPCNVITKNFYKGVTKKGFHSFEILFYLCSPIKQ